MSQTRQPLSPGLRVCARLVGCFARLRDDPEEVTNAAAAFGSLFCILAAYFVLLPLREEAGISLGTSTLPTLFGASLTVTVVVAPAAASFLARAGLGPSRGGGSGGGAGAARRAASADRALRRLYLLLAAVLVLFWALYHADNAAAVAGAGADAAPAAAASSAVRPPPAPPPVGGATAAEDQTATPPRKGRPQEAGDEAAERARRRRRRGTLALPEPTAATSNKEPADAAPAGLGRPPSRPARERPRGSVGDPGLTAPRRLLRATFYVAANALNLVAAASMWARCADAFSAEAARRLYGVVSAGATLGQLAGSLAAVALTRVPAGGGDGAAGGGDGGAAGGGGGTAPAASAGAHAALLLAAGLMVLGGQLGSRVRSAAAYAAPTSPFAAEATAGCGGGGGGGIGGASAPVSVAVSAHGPKTSDPGGPSSPAGTPQPPPAWGASSSALSGGGGGRRRGRRPSADGGGAAPTALDLLAVAVAAAPPYPSASPALPPLPPPSAAGAARLPLLSSFGAGPLPPPPCLLRAGGGGDERGKTESDDSDDGGGLGHLPYSLPPPPTAALLRPTGSMALPAPPSDGGGGGGRPRARQQPRPVLRRACGDLAQGFAVIARSPYLLRVCAYTACATVTGSLLYFQRAIVVAATLPGGGGGRAAYFARLNSCSAALIALAQLTATGAVLRRVGVPGGLLLAPAVCLATALAVARWPTAACVAACELARKVAGYAVTRPAREVLFTVVSREEKLRGKVVLDSVVQRAGDALAAALFAALDLWLGRRGGHAGAAAVGVVAAVGCAAWAGVAVVLGAQHVRMARAARMVQQQQQRQPQR